MADSGNASENAKMNDLIRRATGHTVAGDGSDGSIDDAGIDDTGDAAPSIGGKADAGEGGIGESGGHGDMNAELRRATGRPGHVDASGRAWA